MAGCNTATSVLDFMNFRGHLIRVYLAEPTTWWLTHDLEAIFGVRLREMGVAFRKRHPFKMKRIKHQLAHGKFEVCDSETLEDFAVRADPLLAEELFEFLREEGRRRFGDPDEQRGLSEGVVEPETVSQPVEPSSAEQAAPGDHADVRAFEFDGADVRVVMINDEPQWVAADVARALGYRDAPAAVRMLRDRQKGYTTVCTPGGPQRMTVVNESGLYRMILRSNRPDADRFQDWVTDEVLPSIRKTGSYTGRSDAGQASLVEAMPALPQTFGEALRMLADQVEATAVAEEKARALKPAAEAWEVMASARGDYKVADVAKILSRDPSIDIGCKRLFEKLVELRCAYTEIEHGQKVYRPYQHHVDAGRFTLRLGGPWRNPRTNELESGRPQLRVTVAGLEYLHRKLGGTEPLKFEDQVPEQLAADALTAMPRPDDRLH